MSSTGLKVSPDNTTSNAIIPIAKPLFSGAELDGIAKVLSSGWVTQGPVIGEFEQAFCNYTKANYAVATSNCTTSMHIIWLAMGIGAGHEVICPSYSFIASANAVRHAGAEPIFADIDPNTLNLDPVKVKELIERAYDKNLKNKSTGRILKAILLVHQIGIPGNIDAFEKIADQYGIPLVEDAACAIGSSYKNVPIGGSGNACAFSFHPRKVITTGEGGMITTKDEKLAATMRILRAHGMSVSDLARHQAGSTTFEEYNVVGYNYRMTDIQASIGVSQLASLEDILEKRIRIAKIYESVFSNLEQLSIIKVPDYCSRWNYQSYPIRLHWNCVEKRNQMMALLQEDGITTRRGIPPIHNEPVYRNGLQLVNTETVSENSFFIPLFPQMQEEEIERVVNSVQKAYLKIQKSQA